MGRRIPLHRQILFAALLGVPVFLACDWVFGELAQRFIPRSIDESVFRVSSPIYHHGLRPGYSGTAQWGTVRYPIHINSLGMKDATARDVPLHTENWRILLLGDSFTEGVGYAFEETFAGIISAQFAHQAVEVLNGAVVSYAPTIYERRTRWLLEDAGIVIDEVVVFLDISDIEDEASHYTLDSQGHVADRGADAARFHGPVARPTNITQWWRSLAEHSASVRLLVTLRDRLVQRGAHGEPVLEHFDPRDPLGAWAAPLADSRGHWTHDAEAFERFGRTGLELAARALDRLNGLLRAHGKTLTLVVYPWPHQIIAGERDSIQERYWREWSAQRDVAFVDLFPTFIDGREPATVLRELFVSGDVHLNAAGNRRVAEVFLDRFRPRRSPRPPEAAPLESAGKDD